MHHQQSEIMKHQQPEMKEANRDNQSVHSSMSHYNGHQHVQQNQNGYSHNHNGNVSEHQNVPNKANEGHSVNGDDGRSDYQNSNRNGSVHAALDNDNDDVFNAEWNRSVDFFQRMKNEMMRLRKENKMLREKLSVYERQKF